MATSAHSRRPGTMIGFTAPRWDNYGVGCHYPAKPVTWAVSDTYPAMAFTQAI
jgi:hypothetical protein